MPAAEFNIGSLAQAAAVPISTVRYYERQGLLTPSARSRSNYRLYTEKDLQRLLFIRAAQATGFSLKDVAELLQAAPCGRVQEIIQERLDQVDARLRELRHVKRVLGAAFQTCQAHEATGRCRVVSDLTVAARARRP